MPPRSQARRGQQGDFVDLGFLVLPFIVFLGGGLIGLPGIGLWLGLLFSAVGMKAWASPKEDQAPRRQMPGQKSLVGIAEFIGHPFRPPMGFGNGEKKWPPTRISSWWAFIVAMALSVIPLIVKDVGVPIPKQLHTLYVPAFMFFSAIGYFWCIQASLASKRQNKYNGAPPACLDWENGSRSLSKMLPPLVFGVGAVIITFLLLMNSHAVGISIAHLFGKMKGESTSTSGHSDYAGLGPIWAIVVSLDVGIIFVAAIASALYSREYRQPYEKRVQQHMGWTERFMQVLKPQTPPPIFQGEHITEEDGNPVLQTVLFEVPSGAMMSDYDNETVAKRLATSLNVEVVCIHPDFARKDNKPIPQALSSSIFRLEYPLIPVGPSPHLDRRFKERSALLDVLVAVEFQRLFAEVKLGKPKLVSLTILTKPESPGRIIETMWLLDPGVTFDMVARSAGQLQEKVGARWLRVGRRTTADGPNGEPMPGQFVSILFGDRPDTAEFRDGRVMKAADHEHFVELVEWDARFRSVNLATAGLGPRLIGRKMAEANVTEWTFAYPAGLSRSDVEAKMEPLRATTSGWMTFRRANDPQHFRLLTADTDPLDRTYDFMEWAPNVLHGAREGLAWLRWVVGIGVDNQLVTFEFDTDAPHLLIAGETNSGKSMALSSMLLQLAVANSPKDLNFRLVDPKTELPPFAALEHTTHFIEARADAPIHEQFFSIIQQTMHEAAIRFDLIKDAGEKKLSDAKAKGKLTDVPYVILVMDEVAMLLNPPDSSMKKAIMEEITQLANLGRAAGIFLVMATQYPSNATVPNHLREQFSRVGFMVKDQVASRVVIESGGLEEITTKGVGMMRQKGELTRFRGFLLSPGSIDKPSDQDIIFSHLPQRDPDTVLGVTGPAPTKVAPLPAPAPGVFGS